MGKVINFDNSKAATKDSEVMQKWLNLPKEIKEKLINNVFCPVCVYSVLIGHRLRELLDTNYVFNWTLISQLILIIFLYNTIHLKSINY